MISSLFKQIFAKRFSIVSAKLSAILLANQIMSSSKVLRSLSQAALSYYRWLFIQNKITVTNLQFNTVFQEQDSTLISLLDP